MLGCSERGAKNMIVAAGAARGVDMDTAPWGADGLDALVDYLLAGEPLRPGTVAVDRQQSRVACQRCSGEGDEGQLALARLGEPAGNHLLADVEQPRPARATAPPPAPKASRRTWTKRRRLRAKNGSCQRRKCRGLADARAVLRLSRPRSLIARPVPGKCESQIRICQKTEDASPFAGRAWPFLFAVEIPSRAGANKDDWKRDECEPSWGSLTRARAKRMGACRPAGTGAIMAIAELSPLLQCRSAP